MISPQPHNSTLNFAGGTTTHLTERIQLRSTPVLSQLCHRAKNLYNLSNYHIRQKYIKEGYWTRYRDLYARLKTTEAYQKLPAHTAQQVLRLLDQNWKAFFSALQDWQRHPEKYHGRPRIPRYKPKNGEVIVIFTNQQCHIRAGFIVFPKKSQLLPIKTRIIEPFCHIRILPRGNHYIVEIVYEQVTVDQHFNPRRVLSIDLGLNNLVTVVNNAGLAPWRVKGGIVKSINQYYNKIRAQLYSQRDKQGLTCPTRRLQRLLLKRRNKLTDVFHKVSRRLIAYCVAHDFGRIVIGYNTTWKQGIGMGRRTNQNFVCVPFLILVHQIRYKAAMVGIEVLLVDERYTSKVSFLDGESIQRHPTYRGRRVTRGLFRSSTGRVLNADVNGAYNI